MTSMPPRIFILALPSAAEAASFMTVYSPFASPYRSEAARKLRFSEDRFKSFFAEALVKYVLSGYLAVSPSAIVLSPDARGKPRVEHPANAPHFNISHSGDLVAVILDALPVGLDIERIVPLDAIAESGRFHFMNEKELQEFDRTASDETRQRFYYGVWALKESLMKRSGFGLSIDPRRIDTALTVAPRASIGDPPEYCPVEGHHAWLAWVSPGYALAWCTEHRVAAVIEQVRPSDLEAFFLSGKRDSAI
jgi:phosphopantetheinyl transferase